MKYIYGIGINDANYAVTRYEGTKGNKRQTWKCPYYRKWHSMFNRCYDSKELAKHPSYIGCTVCEEWLTFSNFQTWLEQQNIVDWQERQLDKDFLSEGNKIYSPQTCILLPQELNKFLTLRENARGSTLLGTRLQKSGRYSASVNDGGGKTIHLGRFDTEIQAHMAWITQKRTILLKFISKYQKEENLMKGLLKLLSKFDKCLEKKAIFEPKGKHENNSHI